MAYCIWHTIMACVYKYHDLLWFMGVYIMRFVTFFISAADTQPMKRMKRRGEEDEKEEQPKCT